MKVLMINGSAHENGCTATALKEMARVLRGEGIESEIVCLGGDPVRDCTGCGACVRACMLNNVSLTDGRPVWGKNCTHCMACICGCPQKAIEYGKKSVGKPRYQCPEP